MQFKLLAATLLASSVTAEYANYMDCLVKKKCEAERECVNECFQTDKAKQDQFENFNICAGGICIKESTDNNGTTDYIKFYECLPKCYNEHIGKPNDTQVDLNAKASDKKDEEKKEDSKKDGDKKEEEKKDDDKKEGDKKEEEKKDGDKKDDATNNTGNNTTTTKPPAPAPTNNAFKTIPSVFAALFLAALAL
ncbi:hypothetical protein CONCODRAFT_104723 [Conidiobolus coronatus NRRL 28638]|uniref:Extracellular membrane protein CFEM domain-containing protein n=1 Tax=Conidiobolus coronatus (strain ATCC 28846 / CBS 209.66 / NRRL 28638) TaxID=796925 RepID=A0A137P0C4_CONC2|nr:hypothetical protein CONCODRAFT_104723 [Conidiobolus coronatus NRRL 28638]|eukprot:KXN68495.1 hypothetical protein CONCODRAFT_104723 [Conidiobolus coronatus NRRL 28638]